LRNGAVKVNFTEMVSVPDYHLHTPLCRHARGEPVEYAQHALRLGLQEIGFTDHAPMPRDDFDNWRMRDDQLDEYIEQVRRVQKDFPTLDIKLGLEIDYVPGYEDWIRDLADRCSWDYLIGSVHYVSEDWAVDNPQDLARWNQQDKREVWAAYVSRLTQAVTIPMFDIIGHADLPKKFGFQPPVDCAALYRPFLENAKKHGVVIELNTAGLRKECQEIYPSAELLVLACEIGVPITFGSDAHAPEETGYGLVQAAQLAQKVGYRRYCRFTQKKRHWASLEA
jgi:histidinol-phosphatase (PHP family)